MHNEKETYRGQRQLPSVFLVIFPGVYYTENNMSQGPNGCEWNIYIPIHVYGDRKR